MTNERRFYTYAYLRADGTPYYIGKGCGKRAFKKHSCGVPPIDRILFLKINLTEEEAFRHEVYMIAVLGRKDLGTGMLWNFTDGGEGSSGAVRLPELRERISKSTKGRTFTEEHLRKLKIAATGRKVSEDTKEKLSIANKGKVLSEETKRKMSESRKGTVFSEERKQNIRKSKLGKTSSLKGKTYEEINGQNCLERKLKMSQSVEKVNKQVWESTVDGFRSTPGNVAKHNRANGWDPSARVRIS